MSEFSKRLWARLQGWRTILINFGMALFFMLAEMLTYLQVVDWKEIVPAKYAPLVIIGVNLLNIALRHITDKPAPTQALMSKVKAKVLRRPKP